LTALLTPTSTNSKQLDDHMKDWELAEAGFSYDVVAVFGSQSTGKSALAIFHSRSAA
jgi:protein SEY1